MDFSNREIASGVLLFGFFSWKMCNANIRNSAYALVQAFFHWKIFTVFIISYIYISACVYALSQIGIWTTDNVKATVIWAIGFTFRTLTKLNNAITDEDFYLKLVRDIFALSGLIVFIVELYSFSLPVEFIAVFMLTLLTVLHAAAATKSKGVLVEILLRYALLFFFCIYALCSLYQIYIGIDNIATIETLREFGNPILLAILFLPFLYFAAVVFAYETVFALLKKAIKSKSLRRTAKFRAIFAFFLDVRALRRWWQSVIRFNPQNLNDLEASFVEARMIAKREAKPPRIDRSQGWSPYAAMKFLTDEGLRVRDYFRFSADEWSASSNCIDADSGIIPSKISYSMNGTDLVVTELKLLHVVNQYSDSDYGSARFVSIAILLLKKALGDETACSIKVYLEQLRDFSLKISGENVCLSTIQFASGEQNYSRTLVIRSASHIVT